MEGIDKDQRTWGMLSHILTFSGFVIPFGNIIAPLVIWLIKREEFPFVEDQGKESLNFQISMTIYYMVAAALTFIFIGFLVLPALFIFDVIVVILATVRANAGEPYRYPLCIRLIK